MAAYEMVNHPKHYNNYSSEVIDMIEKIWGIEKAIDWCEITAFKYRMRVGTKPGNSTEQDLKKESWYLDKRGELIRKLELMNACEKLTNVPYEIPIEGKITINDSSSISISTALNENPNSSITTADTKANISRFYTSTQTSNTTPEFVITTDGLMEYVYKGSTDKIEEVDNTTQNRFNNIKDINKK